MTLPELPNGRHVWRIAISTLLGAVTALVALLWAITSQRIEALEIRYESQVAASVERGERIRALEVHNTAFSDTIRLFVARLDRIETKIDHISEKVE